MSTAKKCDRCGELYVPKVGDLTLAELRKRCPPPKGRPKDETSWSVSIYDEDDPYDLCTRCSADLLRFLKPIKRGGGG